MYIKIQASPNRGEDGNRGPTDPELQPGNMKYKNVNNSTKSSISELLSCQILIFSILKGLHVEMSKFVAQQGSGGSGEMVGDHLAGDQQHLQGIALFYDSKNQQYTYEIINL